MRRHRRACGSWTTMMADNSVNEASSYQKSPGSSRPPAFLALRAISLRSGILPSLLPCFRKNSRASQKAASYAILEQPDPICAFLAKIILTTIRGKRWHRWFRYAISLQEPKNQLDGSWVGRAPGPGELPGAPLDVNHVVLRLTLLAPPCRTVPLRTARAA